MHGFIAMFAFNDKT